MRCCRVGGIAAIRSELIDDCALARALKRVGPIWLGLTQRVHSIRPYPALRDVGRMITRSAYAQLDYSMLLLGGTILGMTLVYLAPVLLVLLASGMERFVGVVCWIAMALLFQPVAAVLWGVPAVWSAAAVDWRNLRLVHVHVRPAACERPRRNVEGSRTGKSDPHPMTSAGSLRSGKSHRDENFPVASWLIHPRHRGLILAFYQFVRTADDIADHATLAADEKLALLDQLEADLDGRGSHNPEAVGIAARACSARHVCRAMPRTC